MFNMITIYLKAELIRISSAYICEVLNLRISEGLSVDEKSGMVVIFSTLITGTVI